MWYRSTWQPCIVQQVQLLPSTLPQSPTPLDPWIPLHPVQLRRPKCHAAPQGIHKVSASCRHAEPTDSYHDHPSPSMPMLMPSCVHIFPKHAMGIFSGMWWKLALHLLSLMPLLTCPLLPTTCPCSHAHAFCPLHTLAPTHMPTSTPCTHACAHAQRQWPMLQDTHVHVHPQHPWHLYCNLDAVIHPPHHNVYRWWVPTKGNIGFNVL